YLTAELRYLRSERLEQAFRWAMRRPMIRPFLQNMVGPTEKRMYAAVALRQIGPPAADAIPALLEAWKHDCPEVQLNCLHAMASILYGAATDGMSLAEAKVFKAKVVSEAAQRYPTVARDLQISPEIQVPEP